MRTGKPITYAYALPPPLRTADRQPRSAIEAHREECAEIESDLAATAKRFQRNLDHMVWEMEGAAAIPFMQRPQGAKLLDHLAVHDLVIAQQLGGLICAAAEAAPLIEAFRKCRARLYVVDIDLELTADGEAVRRALSLLAALATSYDEQRRNRWAEQQAALAGKENGPAGKPPTADALERLRALLDDPPKQPSTDERIALDPMLQVRLDDLLRGTGSNPQDPASLAREIAGELGVRLTPQQIARLLEKRGIKEP